MTHTGGLEILVLDDNDIDLRSLLRFVKKKELPWNLTCAETLDDARQKLLERTFDIAVVDHALDAGDSGLELLPELGETPAILVTGAGSEAIAAQAIQLKIAGYVIKDTHGEYLEGLVNEVHRLLVEGWPRLRSHAVALEAKVADHTAELQQKNRWLEAVIESMGGGLVVIDPQQRVLLKNVKAAHLAGHQLLVTPVDQWPKGEGIFESNATAVMSENDLPTARALRGESVTEEHVAIKIQDDVRHARVTATPLVGVDGSREGAVLVSQDITERTREAARRQQLEDKLVQAQKFESLAVLAGGIAHDFNNLLVGILGNADVALSEMTDDAPSRPCVEDILTAAHRAADLCRQMLAYSGRGKLVSTTFDLVELVKDTTHLLQASVGKNVQLEFELESGPLWVEGDMTQIRQVVMNLITNASDAMHQKKGKLVVKSGRVVVERDSNVSPGAYHFLRVIDCGVGMSLETQSRMFDPFFSTKGAGRGLGLAAALGIVKSHGGTLQVESRLGEGTTMSLLLPASGKAVSHKGLPPSRSAMLAQGGRVLVIDDEAMVRSLVERAFVRRGFEVLCAVDGESGFAEFKRQAGDIRLVVLDMTLPDCHGTQVFEWIRELDADVPILVSSGYNNQDLTQQLTKNGRSRFLQKPYTMQALFAEVAALFESAERVE